MGFEPTIFRPGYGPGCAGYQQAFGTRHGNTRRTANGEAEAPVRRASARASRFMGIEPMVRDERIELSGSCV